MSPTQQFLVPSRNTLRDGLPGALRDGTKTAAKETTRKCVLYIFGVRFWCEILIDR